MRSITANSASGDENHAVTSGPHADVFRARLEKTHFIGRPIKAGEMWQARRKSSFLSQVLCSEFNWVICCTETIIKSIIEHGQVAVAPYQGSSLGIPDPSFILQLPDDVYTGSNFYAVQKSFDGPFQFDIYFDSGSVKQKLTCEPFSWSFGDKY